jgi:2-phosphosulfolactate phosphatase
MTNIRVAKIPREMDWPCHGVAVVIDVLRATTVITQAIANGADEVIVFGEIDQVKAMGSASPKPLLCGERACKPIDGFDLGNSPSEYSRDRVAGKRLVMTTTNGTRAAIAAAGFETIYAASFNNLSAVVGALLNQSHVSILCAGTDGTVTQEDLLLAGAIIERLCRAGNDEAGAEAFQLWQAFQASKNSLTDRLSSTLGGRNLIAAGYKDDIHFCAQIDVTTVLPVVTSRNPITFRGADA